MNSRALKVLLKATALPAGLEPWAKGFMKGPQWLELV
jgi:hypothetical protein